MTTDEIETTTAPAVDLPETEEPGFEPVVVRRRLGGWRRWALGGVAVAVIAAGALFASSRNASGEEPTTEESDETTAIPVEVATVGVGEVASYISATANLLAEGEVKVLAEAEGRVSRILVAEGDRVAKGQLLSVLDRGDAEIRLEKARVRSANATVVHQRGVDLAGEQLISREDLDKREMEARLASQELAEAEWNLAKTEVRSPISGRVSLRHVQPGQHLRPGDELFQITDLARLIAYLYLPEKDVLGLGPGRQVDLALDAAPDIDFRGRIRQVSPVVDPATGTVRVTIEAVAPPAQVRPGSFVTARIVRERRSDVVVLPKDAVIRELQQAHVFVATRDGEKLLASRRAVTLGLEEDARVEVLAGIAAGEELIVAGQGALKDGASIRLPDSPAAPAATPAKA